MNYFLFRLRWPVATLIFDHSKLLTTHEANFRGTWLTGRHNATGNKNLPIRQAVRHSGRGG